jgi:hypothetical protein
MIDQLDFAAEAPKTSRSGRLAENRSSKHLRRFSSSTIVEHRFCGSPEAVTIVARKNTQAIGDRSVPIRNARTIHFAFIPEIAALLDH